MIALSAALVVVAALAWDAARRHQATQVVLSHERSKPADALQAKVEELGSRVQILEGIADRVLELEAARDGQAKAIADAETKYDAIITHGINECRELMAPLRVSILKAVPGGKADARSKK